VPTLSLGAVGRRFPGAVPVDALSEVTLDIEQGEFVAIEGPSGGGKSTLLNVIGLLDVPTSGEYRIGSEVPGTASSLVKARLRSETFGFIFQGFHLLDRRDAVDSVELGLLYRGVPAAERRRLALDAMRRLGVGHLAATKASLLSGGERQRVAIARALASRAPVIVADEPTGNLDSANSETVISALLALNRTGATVVLVTHSGEVAAAARRRIRLADGRLLSDDDDDDDDDDRRSASPRELPSEPGGADPRTGTPATVRASDVARDAWATLRSRPGRFLSLASAVALGVALAVASLGIAQSASFQVSDVFDSHVSRDVTLQWSPGDLAEQSEAMQLSIPERLADLSGVETAAVLADEGRELLRLGGARDDVSVSHFVATRDVVQAGRMSVEWVDGHVPRLMPGEVLLGSNLARQLEVADLSSAPGVQVGGDAFRVVGVVEAAPRTPELLGAVVTGDGAGGLVVNDGTSYVRALVLTQAGAARQVADQAPLVIDPYDADGIEVEAPVDPRTLRAEVESDVTSTLAVLTGVALLAAVASLANAMILAVVERRQEFGLRRAIGARSRHIFSLVLLESVIIGAAGGVAGLLVGMAGVLGVTIARRWDPVFDLTLAPVAVLGGILIGALGGAVAAARASRIEPSEALRM
jgi:macrolide transport system ATP-binding/permease protein